MQPLAAGTGSKPNGPCAKLTVNLAANNGATAPGSAAEQLDCCY